MQYTAVSDEGSFRCSDLAIQLLGKAAIVTYPRQERAWLVVRSAIEDALYPTPYAKATAKDQSDALDWLSSESGKDVLENVGLNQDWTVSIVKTLSDPTESE